MATQSSNTFVPRVTQLDAVTLDKEINNVLKTQVVTIIQGAYPELLVKWEPEIDALIGLIIWKLSVLKNHATFGQQLLGIKYSGRKQKLWYLALLLLGGKYALDRSRTILHGLVDQSFLSTASRVLHWGRVGIQSFSLVNTALFLGEGKYPTLADRLLGLQPIPASGSLSRTVGYTYMTRELLWHGFIELLVFILPLINYQALSSRVRSIFRQHQNQSLNTISPSLNHHTLCAVCSESPILPYHVGCGHIFCAYCLNASVLADPKFECPLCGMAALNNIQQVQL